MSESEASVRICSIYENYYKDKSREKAHDMYRIAVNFFDNPSRWENWSVQLELFTFNYVCRAYFIDVIRYKEYHFASKNKIPKDHSAQAISTSSEYWDEYVHNKSLLNHAKRASFIAKWLMLVKPITAVHLSMQESGQPIPSERDQKEYFNLNAEFAIIYIITDCIGPAWENCPQKTRDKFYDDLLYHFKFRPVDEKHFFLIFDTFFSAYYPTGEE